MKEIFSWLSADVLLNIGGYGALVIHMILVAQRDKKRIEAEQKQQDKARDLSIEHLNRLTETFSQNADALNRLGTRIAEHEGTLIIIKEGNERILKYMFNRPASTNTEE